MEDTLRRIGKLVRREREAEGLSRPALADRVGVFHRTIERLEGGHNVEVLTLLRIIGGIGYDYEDGLSDFFHDLKELDDEA